MLLEVETASPVRDLQAGMRTLGPISQPDRASPLTPVDSGTIWGWGR
jgi:hypothetical protein